MKKISLLFILMIGILVSCGKDSKDEPIFTIDSTSKNYGNVEVDKTAEQTFTITNTGDGALTISSAVLSGTNKAEFTTDVTTKTIPAKGTYSFKVNFTPKSKGNKSATLVVIHTKGKQNITLKGNATEQPKPSFSIYPTSLNFGDVVNKLSEKSLTITNTGKTNLVITPALSAQTIGAIFSVDTTTQTIAPNDTYTLKVAFHPKSLGDASGAVIITHPNGVQKVPLKGNRVAPRLPRFDMNPSNKDFGEVEVNKTVEQTFTLTNSGSAALDISSVKLYKLKGTDSDFSSDVVAKSIPVNGTYSFKVKFSPKSAGEKFFKLIFKRSDNVQYEVALKGKAIAPAKPVFNIDSKYKDFGDVEINKSAEQTFTIENTGNAPLEIINASLTSQTAFATNFSYPKTIPAKGKYTFRVVFSPKSAGKIEGELQITHSDKIHIITLRGNGVQPKPTFDITTTSLDFGNVDVNKTVEKSFTISNKGSVELVVSNILLTGDNKSDFRTNLTPLTVYPNKSYTFNVRFTPRSSGKRTAKLELTHTNGKQEVTFTGNGNDVASKPIFQSLPNELNFKDTPIYNTTKETISIFNNGNADLVISNVEIIGNDHIEFKSFFYDPIVIAPIMGNYSLEVHHTPYTVGKKSATLVITHSNGKTEIPLGGNGTINETRKAIFHVTPHYKNFGEVKIGQEVEQSFTITNYGNVDLKFTAPYFDNPLTGYTAGFSTDAIAKTIPPNGSYTFKVKFAPKIETLQESWLYFTDGSEENFISFKGTGIK